MRELRFSLFVSPDDPAALYLDVPGGIIKPKINLYRTGIPVGTYTGVLRGDGDSVALVVYKAGDEDPRVNINATFDTQLRALARFLF